MIFPGKTLANLPNAQVSLTSPLIALYASMEWGDLWEDASMMSVLRYLRGSKRLQIPSEWRPVILDGLQ